MPSASAQQQKRHTKQRRKRRAAAAESSSSSSPLQSSEESSEDEVDDIDTSSAPNNEVPNRFDPPVNETARQRSTSPEGMVTSDDASAKEEVTQPAKKRKRDRSTQKSTPQVAVATPSAPAEATPTTATATKPSDLDAQFDAFYLRQVTSEFGNDLERLRQAPDFKDPFVPVLVKALRQGSTLFSESEKKLVLGIGEGT